MKLLLDEQISGTVAERLRGLGHDVVAVTADAELRGSSDRALFEIAQAENRVVITYDRDDFLTIVNEAAAWDEIHAGLVIVHPTRFPSNQISRLVAAIDAFIGQFEGYPGFVTWLGS